ncbi:probable acyl-CoA dehydrogenase 6 [Hyalella azteca]|uniref:Probable acyl-CoA dehydrogenase 6 n=1 Tax=Hyalella azteca TaxID=294128 RepID=A0A8B7P7L6_HYAAZ|nr:probable acyl-CoA dehydrogenase 6 [Hyalella azteca]
MWDPLPLSGSLCPGVRLSALEWDSLPRVGQWDSLSWSGTLCSAQELDSMAYALGLPSLAFGSEKLKQEFLVPSISGEFVACIGVSEPHAGSDVASIKTTAKRVGDDLIINGSKMWITNGTQADWMCCLANTSTDKKPHLNKSLICLPLKTPGVHVARKISKLGMHSSDTAELFFDDVRVPATYIIGEEGQGFTYQMMQVRGPHHRGGGAWLHLSDDADLYEGGADVLALASMAKLKGGRLGREVADACLQYWGGMGYTDEVRGSYLTSFN